MIDRSSRAIGTLPLWAPAGLAAFGIVAMGLVLVGRLDDVLVWPLGLAAATAVAVVTHRRSAPVVADGAGREQRTCDLLVVVLVVVWALLNAYLSSQNVVVYRDPATYAVTGAWLIDHDQLQMATPTEFGDVSGLVPQSAGFGLDIHHDDQLYAQGVHLLPVLLGLAGRLGGEALLLKVNPLLGAVGLLSVYGFARLLARPRSALLATTALALSLPLIYFSRDTYTEPLSMALVFGALAVLWVAQRSGSRGLWFMAGLVAGAGALLRADGYLISITVTGFAAVLVALAARQEREGLVRRSLLLVAGAGVTSLLGWLDAAKLSSGYYSVHGVEIRQQLVVWAVVLVLSPGVVWLGWRTGAVAWLDRTTGRWRAPALAGAIVVVAAVLASRPWWLVSRDPNQAETIAASLARMQLAAGRLPDPTRNYGENSATWLVWYLGLPLVVLGVVGLAVSAGRAVRPRGMVLVPGLAVVVGTSVLFLVRVGITPDHVWASRRYLPVTMPGLAAFAAVGLDQVGRWVGSGQRWRRAVTPALGLAMVLGPLPVAWPLLGVRLYVPQLAQVREVCDALPEDAAVLLVADTGNTLTRTITTFCDVPAVWAHQPDHAMLAEVADNVRAGGRVPVLLLATDETDLVPPDVLGRLEALSTTRYRVAPGNLFGPPTSTEVRERTLLLGEIDLRPVFEGPSLDEGSLAAGEL